MINFETDGLSIRAEDQLLKLWSVEDLKNLKEVPAIKEGELSPGAITLIFGAPACGKTYYALNYANHPKIKKVLYVDTENGMLLMRRRAIELSLPNEKISFTFQPLPLHPSTIPELVKLTKEHQFDVIIIDTLRRGFRGDENESQAISEFFMRMRAFANETQVAVVVLHHSRKKSKDAFDAIEMARGSGDITAAVDYAFYLRKDNGSGLLECVKNRWGMPLESQAVSLQFNQYGNVAGLTVGEAASTLSQSETAFIKVLGKMPAMETLSLCGKDFLAAAAEVNTGGKPPSKRTVFYWVGKLARMGYLHRNGEDDYTLEREQNTEEKEECKNNAKLSQMQLHSK